MKLSSRSPHIDKSLAAVGLVALAMSLLLAWMGRPVQCECGRWLLWIPAARSAHTSQHLLDPYSLTHVLHGFVLLALLSPFHKLKFHWKVVVGLAWEAGWELVENSPWVIERYRANTAALGYSGDTIVNSLGDLCACGLGFLLAKRLGWAWSLLSFFVIEGFLLLWIRDSLLLNVVMLIYSSDALRQWQAGG